MQYADDAQFLHTGTISNLDKLINNVENTLKKVKQYFDTNGLMINTSKTKCMFIATQSFLSKIPNDTIIKFGDDHIIPSSSVKNLGVYMDSTMTFSVHTDEVYKKVIGILKYLLKISTSLDKNTRTLIVQSLVLSKLFYCSIVWGMGNKTNIAKIQKLQNFAGKVSLGYGKKSDAATPFLNKLNWLKVQSTIIYNINMFMYKVINGLFPTWLIKVSNVSDIHTRDTRQNNNIYLPRKNTQVGCKSVDYEGPLQWNKLPEQIRNETNIKSFKNNLKSLLLRKLYQNP